MTCTQQSTLPHTSLTTQGLLNQGIGSTDGTPHERKPHIRNTNDDQMQQPADDPLAHLQNAMRATLQLCLVPSGRH
jgi:hypothetical protein